MMLAPLLALAPVLSTPKPAAPVDTLDYQELAASFLETMGRPGAGREEAAPQALLDEAFLKSSLGLFDVWIPKADLTQRGTAEDYRDLCLALLNAQHEWMDWLGTGVPDRRTLAKDFKGLAKWVDGWGTAELGAALGAEAQNTTELFDADAKLRAQAQRVAHAFRSTAVLGQNRIGAAPVKLVLVPHRKDFVEFIAYAGWQLPGNRSSFWQRGIETWSHFYMNDFQVLALEYASPSTSPRDYGSSYSMKAKTPTGMEQQVVQLALNKLLAYEHGDSLPPSLITGLSINLVTRIYGGCYTRIDGDVRSRVTQKREVFVRGGRPEGGVLPPNTADSRWRVEHGKKHYVPILEQAQKAAAGNRKRGGDRYTAFELQSDSGSIRYTTRAPLLGPSAGEEEVFPDAVYGDYLEFTRAYPAAFLHWLQAHGAGSKKKSAQAFSEFLGQLNSGASAPTVAEVAEAVYGLPLSDPEASKKSLEGKFLRWIAKQ